VRILLLVLLLFFTTQTVYSTDYSKDQLKLLNMYLKDLKKGDDAERYKAVEGLRYYRHPDAIAALANALTTDRSSSVRNRAALSLFDMEADAKPAIPALQQALKDNDSYVRLNAGATLLNLDVDEKVVLPAIQQLLQHPEPRTQVAAARFLSGSVPFLELFPVLTAALKNPDDDVRIDASKVFDDAKTLPSEALPVLVQSLRDPNAQVRKNAASALDVYESKGTAALPALIPALKDPDRDVRFEVLDAITSMGTWGKEALPHLANVIRADVDPGIRRQAVRAMEWIDPEGRSSVPFLLEALKDKDPEVRQMSLEVMASTRPFPVQAVAPAHTALASETDERVKMYLQRIIERGEQEKSYGVRNKTNTGVIADTPVVKKPGTVMPKEEAMRILQEKDIQMTTDTFWHTMHQGDAEVVRAMLAAGFPANTELQNMSALMLAIRNYDGNQPAQREIIQALLDFGADVNFKDENQTTPFFFAAEKCDLEIIRAMMKAGAVLEVQAKGGATTLTQAAMGNQVETIRLLLKSGYKLKNEPNWLMNSTKNPEILTMLRKAGAK
jgi:HEAT repeat protein